MQTDSVTALAPQPTQPLYERVAARIVALIDSGTLTPGQRIPSVRKLSAQLDVSISTVLEAYRLLETRGRIAARPQSGYYVKPRPLPATAPTPKVTAPTQRPTRVTTGDLVLKVLREATDGQCVPLGAALSDVSYLPIHPLARITARLVKHHPAVATQYDSPAGCQALRIQIARRAMDAGAALAPDDLVTTCGSQEAMGLCLRAVAKPGDTIAIESPTYYGLLQIIESLGMKALEIPTDCRTGVSLDALRLALDQTTVNACLFIPNYNNPLGSIMPDESKRELVATLADRDIPLIEDDIYGDLGFTPAGRPKCCKAYDRQGLVLTCSSFSKTIAPGYRVGWVAPGRYLDDVLKLKLFTTLASPTLPQMAVAEFLATGGYDHHLRRTRRTYADLLAQFSTAVLEHFPDGTKVSRPAGGFVLWVELPRQVDAVTLHDAALKRHISIAPGPMFSAKPKYRNFIRLNCGIPWTPRTLAAVATLGELVKSMM